METNNLALEQIEAEVRALLHDSAVEKSQHREALGASEKKIRSLLLSLLDVRDGFDRVMLAINKKSDQVTPQMNIWIGNFRAVSKLIDKILTANSVVPIEYIDNEFDPRWHSISETVVDEQKPDGAIVQEVAKGYLWNGELLRPAEVIIVKKSNN